MVEVHSVQFTHPGSKQIGFPDFRANRREHTLLLGNSGSGKTTLLHLLGGLLKSQSGMIRVNQTVLADLSPAELDRFRGRHIGFVFQKNHLVSSLNVEENLLLAPYLAGLKPDKARVAEVLALLDMETKLKSRVDQLSQGQAQRIAIARALLNKPDIILADEPTSALDDQNCEAVVKLLFQSAAESNATLLIATHDQRLKSVVTNQVLL